MVRKCIALETGMVFLEVKMGNFLASKQFSLFCAVWNGAFAIYSFSNGSWVFGLICLAFSGYCTNNYLKK